MITAVDNDVDTEDKSVSVEGLAENRLGVLGPVPVALVIEDDDERGVQVSTDLLRVDEGSSATYVVSLASEPTGEVSVALARTSGDPNVTASPTLIFTSSSWSTAQTVTVSAAHDLDAKDDSAVIGLSVSGGDYGSVAAAPVTVPVKDDEMESTEVSLSVEPALVPEGAAATPIVATAKLNGGSRDGNLDVSVLVEAGSAAEEEDYAAVAPFTITIPAGAVSGSETITLVPTQDSVDEPDETIALLGGDTELALPVLDTLVTIADDDAVPTFLLTLSDASIAECGGSSTVTATLSHASGVPTAVSVLALPVAPAEGRDFEQSGTALSIAAGSTESTGTIEIAAGNNDVDAPNRIVSVGGHAESILGVSGPVAVLLTIADDDIAEIPPSPDALEVAEEDESGATYALALNSRPTGAITVVVSGMAGTDVSVRPSSLVFTDQSWQRV